MMAVFQNIQTNVLSYTSNDEGMMSNNAVSSLGFQTHYIIVLLICKHYEEIGGRFLVVFKLIIYIALPTSRYKNVSTATVDINNSSRLTCY